MGLRVNAVTDVFMYVLTFLMYVGKEWVLYRVSGNVVQNSSALNIHIKFKLINL